jgi:hypothetical protein
VHRATDLKGQDLRKVDETPTTSDVTGKRRMEVTTQINEVSGRKAETQLQLPEYADVSTQINDTDPGTVLSEAIESANGKNPALDSRVPLISGRSKTFPVRQANLSENCNHLNPQSFGPAPTVSRPSMVTWKGVDDSTPTNPKFPSLSGTLGPWPFATTELGKNRESPPLPDRVPPSPPRCIQCDAQMKYPPDPEPPGEEEFELMPPYVSAPRGGLGHSCTARSSIQCQQCMPSNSPSDPVSPLQSSRTKKQSRRSTKSDIPEHVMNSTSDDKPSPDFEKILDDIAKGYQSLEERFMHCKVAPGPEYAKEQPVADPVKKTPVPRLKLRLVPTSQSSDKTPAPLPPTPIVLDTAFDVASTSTSLESNKISDKDVFRGLHVATAAACDEDIDKWIEEITGCGVRRFLADLSAFEGLGFNSIAAVAKRAAKQRRGELRAWERVREMRLKGAGEDVSYVIVQESDSPYSGADKKLGLVASDQPVMFRTREKKVAKEPSREELIKDMGYKRDYKGQEGSKERAVRMGWRECGTYGGV